MPDNIVQFQVVPHTQGNGKTIYVLTADGKIYFSNSVVGGGAWIELKDNKS